MVTLTFVGMDLNPAGALLPGCVYCTVDITKAKLGSHAVSRGWSCWALACPLPTSHRCSPTPSQVTRLTEAEVVRAGWPSVSHLVWLVGFHLAHQR